MELDAASCAVGGLFFGAFAFLGVDIWCWTTFHPCYYRWICRIRLGRGGLVSRRTLPIWFRTVAQGKLRACLDGHEVRAYRTGKKRNVLLRVSYVEGDGMLHPQVWAGMSLSWVVLWGIYLAMCAALAVVGVVAAMPLMTLGMGGIFVAVVGCMTHNAKHDVHTGLAELEEAISTTL